MHTNKNENLLDYLNELPTYHHKVAFFSSWKLFEYILHQKNASITINCGYQSQTEDTLTAIQKISNHILDWSENKNLPIRSDLLTHTLALEYLQIHHPKIMHIAYNETDEFAYEGKYDKYLQQGHQFDNFISEI